MRILCTSSHISEYKTYVFGLIPFLSLPQPCPPGSVDFRAEQCTSYDEVPFRNKDFTWLPYHDSNNRCALRCKAKGYNFVVTLSPKVLDGTKCEETGRDICINGKCEVSAWVTRESGRRQRLLGS